MDVLDVSSVTDFTKGLLYARTACLRSRRSLLPGDQRYKHSEPLLNPCYLHSAH